MTAMAQEMIGRTPAIPPRLSRSFKEIRPGLSSKNVGDTNEREVVYAMHERLEQKV
jgi:hypothetical protein